MVHPTPQAGLAPPRSANWRDFLELGKPRVVALIVFTAAVGMFLAVPGLPPLPWPGGVRPRNGSAGTTAEVVSRGLPATSWRSKRAKVGSIFTLSGHARGDAGAEVEFLHRPLDFLAGLGADIGMAVEQATDGLHRHPRAFGDIADVRSLAHWLSTPASPANSGACRASGR